MTKVFLRPDAATIAQNNGIGRVVWAQAKWLPKFDIQLVNTEDEADVIAGHTHDYGAARLDVMSCHGLYWSGDKGSGEYNNWHHEANARIIAAARRAKVITVPSAWVGGPFKRDLRISPVVIGHGIELDEWGVGSSRGYVLWAKNRPDDVCNPAWPFLMAQRGANVLTTFIPKGESVPPALNLQVVGQQSSDAMKQLLLGAEVYLATTKETFGIQTLEALACGVPVLGFDWGGTADLIEHERNGYLVKPGDIDGLMDGLAYIKHNRIRLSAAAMESVRAYTWEWAVQKYAELYHSLAHAPADRHTVAVVVTCHNYAEWLPACIDSVLAQTYPVDEVIVVDDASDDNSLEIAVAYSQKDKRVHVVTHSGNMGVARSRNDGINGSSADYIICLDADDMLDPRYVEACRGEMMRDRGLGICWTGLTVIRPPDYTPGPNVWSGGFNWEWQASVKDGDPPHTTIPTGAMFRRALYERAGGYKQEHAPGEDAEFYTRGLSVGFTAKKATELPFFLYRDHGGGAHKTKVYKPIDTWHPWMRDHAYPLGAPSEEAPDVRSYSDPKVSVIIPVGPGHSVYLPDALDSLVGQTMRDWEVIVVDDVDRSDYKVRDAAHRFPFVTLVATDNPTSGPGAARNRGLEIAHAPLVLFLDADDMLDPHALQHMTQAYAEAEGRYIYGDAQYIDGTKAGIAPEYNSDYRQMLVSSNNRHAVTVLMATEDARRLQFDETLPVYEDVDFFVRAAIEGIHGQRLPVVVLHARPSPNGRTERAASIQGEVISKLQDKYKGVKMGGCCGGNGAAIMAAKQAFAGVLPEQQSGLTIRRTSKGNGAAPMVDTEAPVVRMEFIGLRSGAVTYRGQRGREYRGGNNAQNRFANVHPEDVAALESTGLWRRLGISVSASAPRVQNAAPVLQPAQEYAPTAPPQSATAQFEQTPVQAPQTRTVPYSPSQDVEVPEPEVLVTGPHGEMKLTNLTTGEEKVIPPASPVEPTIQAMQAGEEVVRRKRGRPPSKNTEIKTDLGE